MISGYLLRPGRSLHADVQTSRLNLMLDRRLASEFIDEISAKWLENGWAGEPWMTAGTFLVRAHQLVVNRVDEVLAPLDLNMARFEALVLLHFTKDGRLPLGKMGELLMIRPASVTNTIDRLETMSCVQRVPHQTDRRKTFAQITTKGRRLVVRGTQYMATNKFGFGDLGIDEVRRISESLRVLDPASVEI